MNKLLASTAIVAMTALPLAAQTTTTETTSPETSGTLSTESTAPSTTGSATMDATTDTDTTVVVDTTAADTMGTGDFSYTAMNDELMASEFIGQSVYVSEGAVDRTAAANEADWDDVGDISDVLMSRDGEAQAILVDVGGFLGIGAKTVAVDMQQLNIVSDGENADDYFVVFTATREALENAPEFVRADEADAAMGTTATDATVAPAATDTTMATDTTTAPMATDTTAGVADGTVMSDDPMDGMIDPTTLTAEQLQGAPVYDANNEQIGDISELIVGADGTITEAVIDIGGFLGIGAKPVALNFEQIQVMAEDADGSGVRVQLTATEEELEAMPEYEG